MFHSVAFVGQGGDFVLEALDGFVLLGDDFFAEEDFPFGFDDVVLDFEYFLFRVVVEL